MKSKQNNLRVDCRLLVNDHMQSEANYMFTRDQSTDKKKQKKQMILIKLLIQHCPAVIRSWNNGNLLETCAGGGRPIPELTVKVPTRDPQTAIFFHDHGVGNACSKELNILHDILECVPAVF